jgi:hypothetical protein
VKQAIGNPLRQKNHRIAIVPEAICGSHETQAYVNSSKNTRWSDEIFQAVISYCY